MDAHTLLANKMVRLLKDARIVATCRPRGMNLPPEHRQGSELLS